MKKSHNSQHSVLYTVSFAANNSTWHPIVYMKYTCICFISTTKLLSATGARCRAQGEPLSQLSGTDEEGPVEQTHLEVSMSRYVLCTLVALYRSSRAEEGAMRPEGTDPAHGCTIGHRRYARHKCSLLRRSTYNSSCARFTSAERLYLRRILSRHCAVIRWTLEEKSSTILE